MTVEEIYNYLWDEGDGADLTWGTDVERLAEKMYNDGWRRVPKGEWIERIEKPDWLEDDVEVYYECSCCGIYNFGQSHYCPCCGAKMNKEKDND